MDNVEGVHLLTLILMQALDLDVEDRLGIDRNAFLLLDIGCQLKLVILLDSGNLIKHCCITLKVKQLLKFIRILLPAISDKLRDLVGKLTVA